MRTKQGSMLQSLRAAKAFIDTNAASLAGVVNTGARKRLDDAIAALSEHVATQTSSNLAAQGATQQQYALRKALLRDHMAAIARIARADLPVSPAIEPMRMPKGKPTTERLAAAAYGMAKAAAPFTDIFVGAGLPEDFIKQLTDATDAMLATLGYRVQSRGARGGATEGLKARLTEGRKVVGVLDAFVKTALKDDPALLANWNIVKRVHKVAAGPTPLGPDPVATQPSPSSEITSSPAAA